MEIVTSFKKLNYGRFSKKEAPIFLFLFNKKKHLEFIVVCGIP